jgi:hypothetical protein
MAEMETSRAMGDIGWSLRQFVSDCMVTTELLDEHKLIRALPKFPNHPIQKSASVERGELIPVIVRIELGWPVTPIHGATPHG